MGMVYTEITLSNSGDATNAMRGIISEPEIRKTTVKAVVDSGAATLVINEAIRQQLGLAIIETKELTMADGSRQKFTITEPVKVQWKNRWSVCKAMVGATAKYILLGAIPMEDMDLIVCPKKEEVVGAHGDVETGLLISVFE